LKSSVVGSHTAKAVSSISLTQGHRQNAVASPTINWPCVPSPCNTAEYLTVRSNDLPLPYPPRKGPYKGGRGTSSFFPCHPRSERIRASGVDLRPFCRCPGAQVRRTGRLVLSRQGLLLVVWHAWSRDDVPNLQEGCSDVGRRPRSSESLYMPGIESPFRIPDSHAKLVSLR